MTTDKDRAEFEAAMQAELHAQIFGPNSGDALRLREDGDYCFTSARIAWLAWQAARSRSGAVPAVTDAQLDAILARTVCEGEDVEFYMRPSCEVPGEPECTRIMMREVVRTILAAAPEPPQGAVPHVPAAWLELVSQLAECRGGTVTGSVLAARARELLDPNWPSYTEARIRSEGEDCVELFMPIGLAAETRVLVVHFAHAVAQKLFSAQQKYGYTTGWMRKGWMDECRAHLLEHVRKGDPRDAAAYCAFLWFHEESTSIADTPRSGDALVASVEWRDVPGFEGLYQVSSAGDLKTVHTGIVKLAPPRGGGYVKAVLWKDGRRTQTGMHRLVALAFLDGQLEEVNHKNGDRSDNRVDNLEWSTRSHNVSHAHYVLGSNVKPVIARHIESGVERWFPSIEEAGRNGFSPACVYRCAHGLRNKHKGYTWRFDPLVEHSIQQPRATTGDRSDG